MWQQQETGSGMESDSVRKKGEGGQEDVSSLKSKGGDCVSVGVCACQLFLLQRSIHCHAFNSQVAFSLKQISVSNTIIKSPFLSGKHLQIHPFQYLRGEKVHPHSLLPSPVTY